MCGSVANTFLPHCTRRVVLHIIPRPSCLFTITYKMSMFRFSMDRIVYTHNNIFFLLFQHKIMTINPWNKSVVSMKLETAHHPPKIFQPNDERKKEIKNTANNKFYTNLLIDIYSLHTII
jgi:hypothetical protein